MNHWKKTFKTLNEIYPIYLVFLVFIPIVVGYVIDYELINYRCILINLLWIPVFTIPYILSRRKFIYIITCILFFVAGFIEISHWLIVKSPLSLTSLLVISNTNFQESIEFFSLKASFQYLFLLPYFLLFYFMLKYIPVNEQKLDKFKITVISIVALISISFIAENAVHGRLMRKGAPQIANVVSSYFEYRELYKEAAKDYKARKIEIDESNQIKNQVFVLIIGESCNRHHMSLYGAPRHTNPNLEKRLDIMLFNNVVAPFSNTINSIQLMLSEASICSPYTPTSIDLIDVFHSAGFTTYWISNQSPIGIWDNTITFLAKKCDKVDFVNTTSNSSFEATLASSYDYRLIKPFKKALADSGSRKFIVVHLMGSHSAYNKRYPHQFNKFKGKGRKEGTIAEYDNSVLYNDYIINSFIEIMSGYSGKNLYMSAIYLSDHGENVYDELEKAGHDYSNRLPKSNVDIPFMVWLSPKFINSNNEKYTTIKNNYSKPYVSDDLFHSVLDLTGLKTKYLNEKRSIFNEKFESTRKRILEDGKDYDN
jgi:heptose-I-phosphate ethanolaminephosphotransferase